MRKILLGSIVVFGGCGFSGTLTVDTSSGTPKFTFEASQPVDTLNVYCIAEDGDKMDADGETVWSIDATAADEFAGKEEGLESPITYAEVPDGVRVEEEAKDLTDYFECQADICKPNRSKKITTCVQSSPFSTDDLDPLESGDDDDDNDDDNDDA
jgi:hypothetical protein